MKQLAKRLLRRIGIVALSSSHSAVRYVDHPPASVFGAMLLQRFPRLEGLTFVQVGANDGRRFDPIHGFVRRYGWRGVLVEPVPANFTRLKANYAGTPGLTFLRAAVDLARGRRTIYHLSEDTPPPVPEWAWGLASFERSHLLGTVKLQGWDVDVIAETEVPSIIWEDVWTHLPAEAGAACDVLVVDTEGYDITLLRAADLAARRPRLIHFEHAHIPRADRLDFYASLVGLGYDFASDTADTTAWLPRTPDG